MKMKFNQDLIPVAPLSDPFYKPPNFCFNIWCCTYSRTACHFCRDHSRPSRVSRTWNYCVYHLLSTRIVPNPRFTLSTTIDSRKYFGRPPLATTAPDISSNKNSFVLLCYIFPNFHVTHWSHWLVASTPPCLVTWYHPSIVFSSC